MRLTANSESACPWCAITVVDRLCLCLLAQGRTRGRAVVVGALGVAHLSQWRGWGAVGIPVGGRRFVEHRT